MRAMLAMLALVCFSDSVCAQTRVLQDSSTITQNLSVAGQWSLNAVLVPGMPITSGTTNGLLYDNAGVLGNLATASSGVLVTDGSGAPFIGSAAQVQPILGGTFLPHVANNSALVALTGGIVATIVRDGFTTAGDGGRATYTWSSSACSLNSGAGDNGAQIKPTSGTGCWLLDTSLAAPSVQVWGAVGDGTTDDSAALNAAFSSGVPVVRLPTKTFYSSSALTSQVSIIADGLSNGANISGTNAPNGAFIKCANTVATCLTISTPATGSSGQGGLTAKGFAVGFSGTPVSGSLGLLVSSTYQAAIRDVQVFNAVNGFKSYNSGGYGIVHYFDNIATCRITGAHFIVDSIPQVRLNKAQFGCNLGSSDTSGTAYVQFQHTSAGVGPQTVFIVNSQFNIGGGAGGARVNCALNFVGPISSSQLEYHLIGNHIEQSNYVICSDSNTSTIEKLSLVDNEIDGQSTEAFNLNANTAIDRWKFINNTFAAWTSFTLSPPIATQRFTASGNEFGNGTLNITSVAGSNWQFTDNQYFGLTLNGAFGQSKFSGSFLGGGAITNNATTPVQIEDLYGTGGAAWTSFTPGLSFGGGTTGLTYSLQWGRYKVIGNMATVQVQLNLSAVGSSTGVALLTGLPFTGTSSHGVAGTGGVCGYYTGFSGLGGALIVSPSNGTTTANIDQTGSSGLSAVTNSAFTNSSVLQCQFSYPIN